MMPAGGFSLPRILRVPRYVYWRYTGKLNTQDTLSIRTGGAVKDDAGVPHTRGRTREDEEENGGWMDDGSNSKMAEKEKKKDDAASDGE